MATVVGVMDRDGWRSRTDNIVVVDPAARRLTWVPRDLWVESVGGNRVNTAFARGGHDGFRRALAELGVVVDHSVCVARDAVEAFLAELTVRVPVAEPMEFWYPLSPTTRIQDGRKLVRFDPPGEELAGERIHQWLGARRRPDRESSDLERIARQQVFVREVLRAGGADFGRLAAQPDLISASGPEALREVASVRADWSFSTLGPVEARTVDGLMVLVLVRSRWRRLLARVRG